MINRKQSNFKMTIHAIRFDRLSLPSPCSQAVKRRACVFAGRQTPVPVLMSYVSENEWVADRRPYAPEALSASATPGPFIALCSAVQHVRMLQAVELVWCHFCIPARLR